ncbi:MAG TPA: nucleotide exchange factor GrpE [Candidatus Thermoplasmatota archaeon]|jgi:molecular chaperone GrpE|nr:nucleotide exchange factor GrpE [Candidatus Thermoplasmatota archaeon]
MAPPPPPTSTGTRAWLWGRWRTERRRADDLLHRAQWLQAELENVRKQAERDRAQAGERAAERVVTRLLPVLDSLEAAAAADPGLALVGRELERALAEEGLAPIRALGQAFDPRLHDAAQRDARACRDGEVPGLVVDAELRRGWTLRGRVVRPAMVRVVERIPAAASQGEAPPREGA